MIVRESSSVSIGRQDSFNSMMGRSEDSSTDLTTGQSSVNTMADILEIQLITAEERRTEPIGKACKAAAEHRICLQHSLSNTSVITIDETNGRICSRIPFLSFAWNLHLNFVAHLRPVAVVLITQPSLKRWSVKLY